MVTIALAHLLQLYTLMASIATICPQTGKAKYPSSIASLSEEQRQMLMAYLHECLEMYFNGSTPFPPTFKGAPFLRAVYNDKFFQKWFMSCVQKCDPQYLITNTFRFIDDHLKLWTSVSMAPESVQDAILQFLATVPVRPKEEVVKPDVLGPAIPPDDFSDKPIYITVNDVHLICNPNFMERICTILHEKKSTVGVDIPLFIITQMRLFRCSQPPTYQKFKVAKSTNTAPQPSIPQPPAP